MYFSKHNIISKIAGTDKFILVNILSGNADILPEAEFLNIQKGIFPDREEYISKGYLIEHEHEEALFREKYIEFLESRDSDEVQLFFVTNYTCNFKCSYCYQDEYAVQATNLSSEIIDSFFAYIAKYFPARRKYVTLFGGEPLLPGTSHKKQIEYFIRSAAKAGVDVAVVTNGYSLSGYLEIFNNGRIREIQVTLDGTEDIHNLRRPLKNGKPTFTKIVEGIDKALDARLPINLRVVLDRQNIMNLPELASFAIDRGWVRNPLFKTQLGRNYELHHCQSENQRLYSRLSMYEELFKLVEKYPHILEFHRPAFSVSKFLFDEGKLPFPLFDSCPGTKTEWAFDYTGKIYACTATVGKPGEELGTFFPEVQHSAKIIEEWEDRDILSVKECKDCSVQLACGGGCAAVAKNNTGAICSPDCRPIKELIGLGVGLYFKQVIEQEEK
ncbi:MAG: radical SAM protein [Bacteroidales bacterium]|nr:radical SAM protein [Bacteroidales bacterium]